MIHKHVHACHIKEENNQNPKKPEGKRSLRPPAIRDDKLCEPFRLNDKLHRKRKSTVI